MATPTAKGGGSAFPDGGRDGMDLRDYFAARAMPVLFTELANTLDGDAHVDIVKRGLTITARWSYAMADAMLRERDRK